MNKFESKLGQIHSLIFIPISFLKLNTNIIVCLFGIIETKRDKIKLQKIMNIFG
jgi:hypothetical protein